MKTIKSILSNTFPTVRKLLAVLIVVGITTTAVFAEQTWQKKGRVTSKRYYMTNDYYLTCYAVQDGAVLGLYFEANGHLRLMHFKFKNEKKAADAFITFTDTLDGYFDDGTTYENIYKAYCTANWPDAEFNAYSDLGSLSFKLKAPKSVRAHQNMTFYGNWTDEEIKSCLNDFKSILNK